MSSERGVKAVLVDALTKSATELLRRASSRAARADLTAASAASIRVIATASVDTDIYLEYNIILIF
jgi:hypothetical protein